MIDTLAQDIRQAFRSMRRSPGFTLVAIATIALTIGANTAILSFADVILFRPLPFRDPDSLFHIDMKAPHGGRSHGMVTPSYVRAMNARHLGFSEAGIAEVERIFLVEGGRNVEIGQVNVTANYFELLGVKAFRGRLFDRGDEKPGNRAVVLSHSTWMLRFGGDERIVGKSIRLNDTRRSEVTFDVIGVLPRDFVFPSPFRMQSVQLGNTLWRPEIITVEPPGGLFRLPPPAGTFDIRHHNPVVRLMPGVTQAQAQAEIDAIAAGVNPERVATPALVPVRVALYGDRSQFIRLLLAATVFVLLVGCANLSNMLLVRGHSYERESGVRAALGASRGRMVRPLVFEAIVVSSAGGLLAVGLAAAGFGALLARVPLLVSDGAPMGIDIRVILLSMALSLCASLAFSIVPALRLYRFDVLSLIRGRSSPEKSRRIGGPMLAIQVALAVVLVGGAVMTVRSLVAILEVPLGFKPDAVLAVRLGGRMSLLEREALHVRAIQTIKERGDVLEAGAVDSMPVDRIPPQENIYLASAGDTAAQIIYALPGYLEAAGTSVLRGRTMTWNDYYGGREAAIVSESAARLLFPNSDAIGQSFQDGRGRRFTIVGLAEDIRRDPEKPANPVAYALPPAKNGLIHLVVQLRDRRERSVLEIRRQLGALLPAGTAIDTAWWTDLVDGWAAYRNPRFQAMVFGSLAVLAVGLVALGVFSLVAFLVARRLSEIGIRLALGASPAAIQRHIVAQAAIPVAVGALAGLAISFAAGNLAEAYLFRVQAYSPLTLVGAVLSVILVGIGASYFPARQASRVDPLRTLKHE